MAYIKAEGIKLLIAVSDLKKFFKLNVNKDFSRNTRAERIHGQTCTIRMVKRYS